MPANIISSFAKKTGKSKSEVEKIWNKLKSSIKSQYPDVKEGSPRFYKLVTGSLKNALKLEDAVLSTDIAVVPSRLGQTNRRKTMPDDFYNNIPVFDVDGDDFNRASKVRTNFRFGLKNEKVMQYMKENNYRKMIYLRNNGNLVRMK